MLINDKPVVDCEVEFRIAPRPRDDERAWVGIPARRRSAIVQAGNNVDTS